MVQSSYLRKSYLSTFQQAPGMPVTRPTALPLPPASLLSFHKAHDFGGQHYGWHMRYREPAEDGTAAGYLVLPDGTDLAERMCNVWEHLFSSPKGDLNSSCLFFVVRLEHAFVWCTENQGTTPPPEAADKGDDEDASPGFFSSFFGGDEAPKNETSFSECVDHERPKVEPEEVCRDLYNVSAENQSDAPGGEPFNQCFKDADLVNICFGQCGGAPHARYSFLECIGDCYHFNITEEAKTPIPEPTTPPIPPPLIPIVGHMWNASLHLDRLHGNLRNISRVSKNVTTQWEERFPDRALPTTMPPDLVDMNDNSTEKNDTLPTPGIGLLARVQRGLHSLVSRLDEGSLLQKSAARH